MKGSARRAAVSVAPLCLTVVLGCDEDPALLDPQRIHDIARSEGTARGEAFSGRYEAQWLAQSCRCAGAADVVDVTGCVEGVLYVVPLHIIHSDGFLRMSAAGYDINGGIDEDGTFEAGALADGTTFGTRGELIVYVDGTISIDRDGTQRIEAQFIRHLEGELLLTEDAGPVDCTDTFALSGSLR